MSTQISLQTVDGRIINGISFSVNAANIPTPVDPVTLSTAMPGGLQMGVYHVRTSHGWEMIPANQVAVVLQIKPGAPT